MDIELICRTCLTRTAKCISIFKEPDLWGKTIPLSKMIMACAPININEGDGFPSHICESCLKQLQFSFLFRMRILQSDEQLKACEKRRIKPDLQSESSSFIQYVVQHNTESVYSIKEILESSANKDRLAVNSSVKPSKNKGPMPKINLLPKPIEEVMVPMISDILYEETIDTKVLPSVKNSRMPPKTIGEVDLTDDKTDVNVPPIASSSTTNETLDKHSENQPNVSNNIIVHPLQITNQVLLPSNYNYCVSENASSSYFAPNKEQMLQFQHNSNKLIQLQDCDKSILQNLLQTQNKVDNHYIVIAGGSGGEQFIVGANQIDPSKTEHTFNVTNKTSAIQFAHLNQQNTTPLRCFVSKDEFGTVPHLNQQNSSQINKQSAVQQPINLKAYEHNYYNFLSDKEKRKVNELLSTKRSTNSKRNSTELNCVDLTSDAEDEFTNTGDSMLKITHVSSQANKKKCFTKKS